jgi:hypothetical protein
MYPIPVLYEAVCCLTSTLGFADALSQDGVKFLAASPETMLAPGVPTGVPRTSPATPTIRQRWHARS